MPGHPCVLKQETSIDKDGLKTTVTLVQNGTDVIKTTTREKRVSKHVIERQSWKLFGDAIKSNDCTFIDQTTNITDPNEDVNKRTEINNTNNSTSIVKPINAVMHASSDSTKAIKQTTYKPPPMLVENHANHANHANLHVSHFKKEPYVTVKISNIPDTLTEKWLRTLGSKHGKVMRCKIPKNKQGRLLNFAFVSYTDKREASAFIKYIKGNYMDNCILDAQITVR